jgi:hypothetical protein
LDDLLAFAPEQSPTASLTSQSTTSGSASIGVKFFNTITANIDATLVHDIDVSLTPALSGWSAGVRR